MTHVMSEITLGKVPRNLQDVHSMVVHAALAGEPRRRVLWMLAPAGVLLVRHDRPVYARDFPPGVATGERHYAPPPDPAAGDRVSLVWVANPSRTVHYKEDGRTRSTTRFVPPSQREQWARDRVGRFLDITSLTVVEVWPERRAWGRTDGCQFRTCPVLVRAEGVVTDPDLLAKAAREGLGRGKAFGTGMVLTQVLPVGVAA